MFKINQNRVNKILNSFDLNKSIEFIKTEKEIVDILCRNISLLKKRKNIIDSIKKELVVAIGSMPTKIAKYWFESEGLDESNNVEYLVYDLSSERDAAGESNKIMPVNDMVEFTNYDDSFGEIQKMKNKYNDISRKRFSFEEKERKLIKIKDNLNKNSKRVHKLDLREINSLGF